MSIRCALMDMRLSQQFLYGNAGSKKGRIVQSVNLFPSSVCRFSLASKILSCWKNSLVLFFTLSIALRASAQRCCRHLDRWAGHPGITKSRSFSLDDPLSIIMRGHLTRESVPMTICQTFIDSKDDLHWLSVQAWVQTGSSTIKYRRKK